MRAVLPLPGRPVIHPLLATLLTRNLNRLAARALVGLARTGAAMSDGSGDYALEWDRRLPPTRPGDAGQ